MALSQPLAAADGMRKSRGRRKGFFHSEIRLRRGTRKISGIITGIEYALDVNTGEHIKADKLSKNGIAVCNLLLAEPIVADLFSAHKTLGELILINRVTYMTSACGVIEKVSQRGVSGSERASFSYGGLEARGDIFEEFCYDTSSLNVLKYQPVRKTYTVGDEIPTGGDSYSYPDSFDIIVLRDMVAVSVSNRVITAITSADDYEYSGVPVINGRGFEILADSQEKVKAMLDEYRSLEDINDSEFFTKWLSFNTYRKIVIGKV